MRIPSQFSLRTLLEVIAVAAFVCTLIYFRALSVSSAGRYQLFVTRRDVDGLNAIIFDTQTGRTWAYGSSLSSAFDPDNPPH